MKNKIERIVFFAGGTGGHIYPAIAVADELLKNHNLNEIIFFISGKSIEKSIFSKKNFTVITIPSAQASDIFSINFFSAIFNLIKGFFIALFNLKKIKPDIVISMGGYSTVPSAIASYILKIPIILHEQNSVMGKANLFISKLAKKITLSFDILVPNLPKEKVIITGNPVRKEIVMCKRNIYEVKEKISLLVIGGSQGSKAINETVCDMLFLDDFPYKKINKIMHITGYKDYENVLKKVNVQNRLNFEYLILPYKDEIWEFYSEADLVISRAGATAIFEITSCNLPSILIPYPFATEDHQKKNAQILEKIGAAILLPQEKLSDRNLLDIIIQLLNNKETLKKMSENCKKFYKKDSVKELIKVIYETAGCI